MKRLIVILAVACSEAPDRADEGALIAAVGSSAVEVRAAPRPPVDPNAECRARIERELQKPGEPGIPELERVRAQVLGRAKATPVLFTSEPAFAPAASAEAEGLRQSLQANATAKGLGQIYRRFYKRPDLARAVFLRDGYLYTREPQLAFALLEKVELGHLFDAEQLVIQRGSETLLAHRKDDEYVYASGSETGEKAKVLLFDRVWDRASPPGPALHVDLEVLSADLGFWRAR